MRLVPLALIPSPRASSMANSARVTSSLLVTSRPSPPVPAPWSLKLRMVLPGPCPRSATWLTSSESVERNSNRPSPSSMVWPGLALMSAA